MDNLRRKSVESSSSRASATSNIKSSSPSKTGASYGTFPPHGSELQRPTLLCTSESASSYVENSIGSIPSGLNKLSLATPSPAQLLKSASKELSPPEQSTPSPIKIPIHQGMRQEWIDNLFHPVPPSAFSSKLDLDKCLKGFMAVESLEGDNAWACEKCALRQHQQEQAIRLQREEAIVRRNFDDSKQSLHAMSIVESIGSARTPESVSAAVFRAPSPSSIKSLSGLATLNKASLNMHHEDQEMQTSDTGGKGTIAIKDLNMSMISTELSAVDLNDTDDGDRPTILSPVPMSITSQRLVSDDENRNADSFMPTSAEPFSSSSDSSSLSSVPDCSSSDLSFLVTAKLNKKKEQKHNQQIRPTLPVQPESAVSNEFLQAASNPAKLPPVFRSARKRYLIYKLPEILVLNLKRFQQAHGILGSRRMAKIGDIVDFNQTLDLGEVLADGNTIYEILQLNKRSGGGSAVVDDVPVPPAVVAEAPIPDDRSDGEIMRKAHYKLYGVVVHSGSLFGG